MGSQAQKVIVSKDIVFDDQAILNGQRSMQVDKSNSSSKTKVEVDLSSPSKSIQSTIESNDSSVDLDMPKQQQRQQECNIVIDRHRYTLPTMQPFDDEYAFLFY